MIQGKYHAGVSANAPFWDANITGLGQVVGAGDTGADRRNCYLSGANKFVMYNGLAMDNGVPNESDEDGHGTHVCGSIAGSSGLSGSENHDGVAKDAQLAFTDFEGSDGRWSMPNNMGNDFFQHAYDVGARIHSNSWGAASGLSYTVRTYEIDEFAAANPMFLPMFAVGNSKLETVNGRYTYGSPANAKNILAIGSTMSSNSRDAAYLNEDGKFKAWSVEIGGPDAKHWAHSNIRGLSPWFSVSNPSTHAISAQSVVYAEPADGCSALTNAAAVARKLVLISSRGSCSASTKVRPRPFSVQAEAEMTLEC